MNRPTRIVFFDLETGGLDPEQHPILQIAAVVVDSTTLDEIESFDRKILVNVDSCDAKALEMNHFQSDVWAKEALPSADVRNQFTELLRRHSTVEQTSQRGNRFYVAQMAGHNIASFDMLFLQRWFKNGGAFCPASYRPLDTLQRAAWHFQENDVPLPKDLKLGTLCDYFGVPIADGEAHDALSDVRGNIAFYRVLRANGGVS